ncbi:hypothetical protein D3C78_1453830 [compost metagenome]
MLGQLVLGGHIAVVVIGQDAGERAVTVFGLDLVAQVGEPVPVAPIYARRILPIGDQVLKISLDLPDSFEETTAIRAGTAQRPFHGCI